MRIVRTGGQYLQCQATTLARLASLMAGMAVLAALLLWSWPLVLVPVVSALLLLCVATWRRRRSWLKGARGEQLVTTFLNRLPEGYVLVNDVVLPGMKGNADHVLIGPSGLLVLEAKHYAGKVYCNGDRWWINGTPRRSLSGQANLAAAEVRNYLVSKYPELRESALRYVRAAVVFTNPCCRLEIRNARAIVIRLSELPNLLRDMGRKLQLEPGWVNKLASSLALMSRFTERRS